MNQDIKSLEDSIIKFANNLLSSYSSKFEEKGVLIKEPPRIESVSDDYREFILFLWNNRKSDFLIIEFPTLVEGKCFCSIEQAKDWIIKDIDEFLRY